LLVVTFVEHGRCHDERRQKVRQNRYSNTPPDPEESAPEILAADEDIDFEARAGQKRGSESAPTEQAARREAERHRLEREMGHVAAGTGGFRAQVRPSDVSREDLSEAARRADEAVAPHHKKHG
jgi:hypothetical protein